jgi:hypothetical protein
MDESPSGMFQYTFPSHHFTIYSYCLQAAGTHQASLLGLLFQDHELLSGLSPAEKEERLMEVGVILFGG